MVKQTKKNTKRKRDTSICYGCINEFNNSELTNVSIKDRYDIKFTSVFCDKCIKEENFPQNKKYEIIGPAKKERKTTKKKKK